MNAAVKSVEFQELNDIVSRIWDRLYTLVRQPSRITDKLGWLDVLTR